MASSSLTQLQEEGFFSHKIISIPQAMEMPKKITELPEKSTLVFYAESDNTEEALSFLKKVLMAVHLTPEQNVLLLCLTANTYFSSATWLHTPNIAQVLVFGLKPSQIGLHINATLHESFLFNGKSFIFSAAIHQLIDNPQEKKALWGAMKVMFQL